MDVTIDRHGYAQGPQLLFAFTHLTVSSINVISKKKKKKLIQHLAKTVLTKAPLSKINHYIYVFFLNKKS